VAHAETSERGIEGINRGGRKQTRLFQSFSGTDAEDVKQEGGDRPEEPRRKDTALGVGLGFGLACGLFVHGESVAQHKRFNRREQRDRRELAAEAAAWYKPKKSFIDFQALTEIMSRYFEPAACITFSRFASQNTVNQ
jgi:hypothetical protein